MMNAAIQDITNIKQVVGTGSSDSFLGVAAFNPSHYLLLFFGSFMETLPSLKDQWYPLCACGCGGKPSRSQFGLDGGISCVMRGHLRRIVEKKYALNSVKEARAFIEKVCLYGKPILPFCLCGCGQRVKLPAHRFIANHFGGRPRALREIQHTVETCRKKAIVKIEKRIVKYVQWQLERARKIHLQIVQICNLCECGCGNIVSKKGNRFVVGHQSQLNRGKKYNIVKKARKICVALPFCSCGCGQKVAKSEHQVLKGHCSPRMRAVLSSEEHKVKKRTARLGYIHSQLTREKMRKTGISRAKIQGTYPSRGDREIEFMHILQGYCKYTIDTNYEFLGYVVDGYIHELNLVVEFDESYHEIATQRRKDQEREQDILASFPDICFWRVKEKDWVTNQTKIINDFVLFCEGQ